MLYILLLLTLGRYDILKRRKPRYAV